MDELAHSYVADGEHRTLEQARADAMIDLILGQAKITTTVELNLPLSALPAPGQATGGGSETSADPAGVGGGQGGGCSCGATSGTPAGPGGLGGGAPGADLSRAAG